MTRREFARLLRKVHRDRCGEILPLPEEADEVIEEAETEIGFAVPEAARYLFTLAGPDFVDLAFAVGEYVARRRGDDTSWPAKLLAIKDLGADCWVCLDCKPKNGPVYVFREGESESDWPDKFELIAPTLVEYFRAFLDAEGEFPGSPAEGAAPAPPVDEAELE